MKKRKLTTDYDERLKNHSNFVSVTTEVTGQTFFEIGNEITTDLAEAVAIMMRLSNVDDAIWEKDIVGDISEICPEKCLYWLTGGIKEWKNLDNYKKPWSECNLIFQEEFGHMVMKILRKAKKFKDVREGFIKHLNLLTLYDFAISQDLVK